ncbi:hypothetical protein FA13DRAFT_1737562 [Coprinellus micaceus]|uniref:Uncharacterized protein n=1 Tax=Coprinellus micaceus TaxID=71717 RepID=A0A4Y7RTP4_COPMI|nr:hypothetical protein FA13DRAFT_1748586 [Coprinellus micaceus]TEB26381.1 hypothetical protein FA13DRAFT_1737562 [Coprinellus micaceus]
MHHQGRPLSSFESGFEDKVSYQIRASKVVRPIIDYMECRGDDIRTNFSRNASNRGPRLQVHCLSPSLTSVNYRCSSLPGPR